MRDVEVDHKHRLKASELLAKAQGDFEGKKDLGVTLLIRDFSGGTTGA